MTIYAAISGYPSIELHVLTPIKDQVKIRQQGITFIIRPTGKQEEYYIEARKGRLILNTFTIKEKP